MILSFHQVAQQDSSVATSLYSLGSHVNVAKNNIMSVYLTLQFGMISSIS